MFNSKPSCLLRSILYGCRVSNGRNKAIKTTQK